MECQPINGDHSVYSLNHFFMRLEPDTIGVILAVVMWQISNGRQSLPASNVQG
jgi:hypothetical protein